MGVHLAVAYCSYHYSCIITQIVKMKLGLISLILSVFLCKVDCLFVRPYGGLGYGYGLRGLGYGYGGLGYGFGLGYGRFGYGGYGGYRGYGGGYGGKRYKRSLGSYGGYGHQSSYAPSYGYS